MTTTEWINWLNERAQAPNLAVYKHQLLDLRDNIRNMDRRLLERKAEEMGLGQDTGMSWKEATS